MIFKLPLTADFDTCRVWVFDFPSKQKELDGALPTDLDPQGGKSMILAALSPLIVIGSLRCSSNMQLMFWKAVYLVYQLSDKTVMSRLGIWSERGSLKGKG